MSELNNIPKHWQVKKLGEVCRLKNGFAFKSTEYQKEGVPVIRISDINQGIVSGEDAIKVQAQDVYENYLVENNDILVAMSGATTGKFGIYKSTEKAYQNQRVGKFKILNEKVLNNQFLFYQINSLKRQIEKDAYGGAQPNISSNKIEQMEIVLPPLPEQLAVVSKIEELLSDLENGKQQLLIAQQQLKVYRQSLLKAAFTSTTLSEQNSACMFKNGWQEVKIKDVAEIFGGFAFKSGEFLSDGNYQVLRMGNVRPGIIRYGESPVFLNDVENNVLNKALLQPNDIIITQTGTRKKRDYGFTALIQKTNLLLNQRIAAIRFNAKYLPKFFLYFSWTDLFKDQFFANETGNVGQGNVGMKAVTETIIPFCSLSEQQLIIDELESKLTVCDKIEETISQSLQQAETLKQSILKKAFEGRLV